MKRLSFLFAVILGACVIGTTTHAQFSSNPMVEKTTNTTALVPIGNGFGLALLGYGLPEYNPNPPNISSNYLFFATPMGQPSANDGQVVSGNNQFYVVQSDAENATANPNKHTDYFAFKVLSPVSAPTNLTIVRTWIALASTNNLGAGVTPTGNQAGSLAACGVDSTGRAVLRVDASSSPNGSKSFQAYFVFNAETNSTVVVTQVLNNASLNSVLLVTNDGPSTMKYGSLGRNNGLFAGNGFGGGDQTWGTQFVARLDITPSDSTKLPHAQTIATDGDRSAMAINDTAKVIAYWKKSADDASLGSGVDACTHLAVFYYNDSGGNITLDTSRGGGSGSNDYVFGTYPFPGTSTEDTINTNAIDFFGAIPFNGPPHISINDAGEMAFPVSINCFVGNFLSNGTRSATITGILFKDANSSTFRKVVDNQDTSLFAPAIIPGPTEFFSETNNVVSPPVLDNKGNVFFTAGLTNFLIGGTNPVSDIALYQSVPNQYPSPTSWTTRIVVSEGRTWTEPTSGDTLRILAIPLHTGAGSGSGIVPRGFGANSINRVPAQGTCADLGGVILTATITNITQQLRYDGVLYIAPITNVVASTQFVITSVTRSVNNNINITWNGQTGNNIVQVSTGTVGSVLAPAGSFTNNFVDLTTVVVGCPPTSQTYVDPGAATNKPSRYYRIKLGP